MNKDNKNIELNNTDKKLQISDVMCSVLSLENIEVFRNQYNVKMKVIFGVDNWIQHYENKYNCKLEEFIGKTCEETKDILSHIDRDWEE